MSSADVPDPRQATAGAFDARLAATVLAALFAAGATLALLVVALPDPRQSNEAAVLAIVAAAYATGAVLFLTARRASMPALQISIAWATTLVAAIAYLSHERPCPLVLFFCWVALYPAYFFRRRREAAAQLAVVAGAFAAVLLARPPASGGVLSWWIAGVGTLGVAALLVVVLRERSELLVARLCAAARTDPLTGLVNRYGLREALDLEIERVRRANGRLVLVATDIDGLKELNDRTGHHTGDEALRRIGGVLGAVKRQGDVAARTGSGEFALVLPDTDVSGALRLIDRLRDAITAAVHIDGTRVTMSYGVAWVPDHGETAASVIRACDEALAAAKREGGDRAVLHQPEMRGLQRKREDGDVDAERYVAVMIDLAEAVDLRFSGSARHSETVGRYAEMMAQELGLPAPRIARVRLAGMLHDIGKVGVPDCILHKPARLSDDEFAQIRRHPQLGAQILEHPSLADIRQWVGSHHERPDGRGYPLGLAGGEISLEAQIIAVADAYEAMTSDRAYRSSIGRDAARQELERCAGTQFDPGVVRAFLALLDRDARRARAPMRPAA